MNCSEGTEDFSTREILKKPLPEGKKLCDDQIIVGSLKNLSGKGLLEVTGPASSSQQGHLPSYKGA